MIENKSRCFFLNTGKWVNDKIHRNTAGEEEHTVEGCWITGVTCPMYLTGNIDSMSKPTAQKNMTAEFHLNTKMDQLFCTMHCVACTKPFLH